MKNICILFIAAIVCMAVQTAHSLTVHSLNSKILVADISDETEFDVIERGVVWNVVRFSKPSVPVWVSRDYLRIEGNTAVVTANRLNMRLSASIEGKVLGAVDRGYQSLVLESNAGFSLILAPVELRFSIRSTTRDVSPEVRTNKQDLGNSKDGPKWQMQNKASQVVEEPRSVAVRELVDEVEKVAINEGSKASASTEPVFSEERQISSTSLVIESPSEAEQHRLSPGDTISLQVFGESDLSLSHVRIPQSGAVSFPLIGAVEVAGQTTNQVESIVSQKLSQGYIRDPRLSITIDSYRPIFIKGAVQNIGAFPYTEGLTIAKALALAGGAKNSAKKEGVSISRDGSIVSELLSLDSQYRISSGDIISVSEELGGDEGSAFYVYLHGEVNRPGEYLFRRGLTVEKAVVLAGGFTLRASRKKISVSRAVDPESTPEKLKKVPLFLPIEPGDIIDVGASWF
jgi:polysaccharide export outer membrane protein